MFRRGPIDLSSAETYGRKLFILLQARFTPSRPVRPEHERWSPPTRPFKQRMMIALQPRSARGTHRKMFGLAISWRLQGPCRAPNRAARRARYRAGLAASRSTPGTPLRAGWGLEPRRGGLDARRHGPRGQSLVKRGAWESVCHTHAATRLDARDHGRKNDSTPVGVRWTHIRKPIRKWRAHMEPFGITQLTRRRRG